jgi:hypothetical protein
VSNSTPWTNYNFSSLVNANVQGGSTFTLNVNLTATGVNSYSTYSFSSWLITARGNTVALEQKIFSSNIIISAQVAQGIGSIGMDFGSFVYYNVSYVSGKYRLQVWPDGKEGYYAPQSDIAFRVILTNFDTNKRTITLSSHSALWMIFKTNLPQQPRSGWWHIVNVNSTGWVSSQAQGSFSSISLPYAQPIMVYFASESDLGTDNFKLSSPGWSGPAAVNLMVFGTIGTSTFGQNIPFVSVYVT